MIYTTYFGNIKNLPESITPIAICGGLPKSWGGLSYKALAPKYSFWSQWKETHDNEYYIEQYQKLVLSKLTQEGVVNDLSEMSGTKDFALVCYEKPKDFCHRHLVSKWLIEGGFECTEYFPDQKMHE